MSGAHRPQSDLTAQAYLPRETRWRRLGQRPVIAWLTGLSGAGKSSIARAAERALTERERHVTVLDGDNLRRGLTRDLGFSAADRAENIRRTAEAAKLLADTGLIVIVALISPFRAERAAARGIADDVPFLEIFVDAPLALCETRDPKGLYGRARSGAIPDFTGISSPYEAPSAPDLTIRTQDEPVEASAGPVVAALMACSAA